MKKVLVVATVVTALLLATVTVVTALLLATVTVVTAPVYGETQRSKIGSVAGTLFISMTTDRTRYVRGEMIKLVVTNNLDIPIWYIGYSQPDLVFWTIERAKDNGWHNVGFRLPLVEAGKEVCRIAMYERPIGVVTDLKPAFGSSLSMEPEDMPKLR